ncbi:putative membrane protein [Pectobacterium phage vB_PatM_CB7]|nr:putative membrane protein [Pectobacterium phage vB_PatM_CB7]
MEQIVFYSLWALFSVVGVWRMVNLMSMSGRVGNDDRVMVLFILTPASLLLTPVILVVELLFWVGKKVDNFRESPRYVTWKIQRQIRKRRRGPLVRVVEHLYNKRKEKAREEGVSEI